MKFLSRFIALITLAAIPSLGLAQLNLVNCAPSVPCTLSGPSATGTGDQAWLAFGKINGDVLNLQAQINALSTTLGIVTTGVWNATTIGVPYGGTGTTSLTGLVKGNGVSPFTNALATDVSNLFGCGGNPNLYQNGAGGCTSPSGSGTLTPTGSPATGNLAVWSGPTTLTNGNLSGDCTTSATLVVTCTSLNGQAVTLAGSFGTSGAFSVVFTFTGATNVTVPTSGTLVTTTSSSLPNLSTVGTILSGIWNGSLIAGTYGGTGINNGTHTFTNNQNSSFTSSTGNVGTLELLQNAQSSNYTLVLADNGREIYNNGSSQLTFTIPANASVAFPIGTCIVFTGSPTQGVIVAINSDILYWQPSGTTGSRTVSAFGSFQACKKTSTIWYGSGNGVI